MIRLPCRFFAFLAAFVRHRWGFRFRDRAALEAFQRRRMRRLLRRAAEAPFYRGRSALEWASIPIVDKPTMLSAFDAFNTAGITLEEARRVALEAETTRNFRTTLPADLTVGSSSGTSGQPSLFLVSSQERAQWAGAVLGRMLSASSFARVINPFARPLRIAFFLRANSNLYTTVHGWRIRFRFFDLIRPIDAHRVSLNEFQPDVLVAPASVLQHLAVDQRRGLISIHPAQVINVAECLEPADAAVIAEALGSPAEQIYQCTEGVLGFTCPAGSVHLNEECIYFEPRWLDDEGTRFSADITDFSRSTQMFIRFRMDDILHVDPTACTCGRVTMRLRSIEGRTDEVLWLPSRSEPGLMPIFPDQVRQAVMVGAADCPDYQIEQHGLTLKVSTSGNHADNFSAIRTALGALLEGQNSQVANIELAEWRVPMPAGKRRRIRCIHRPQSVAHSA